MQDLLLQIQETVRAYREARDNLENLSLQRIEELHTFFTSNPSTQQFLKEKERKGLVSLISELEQRLPKPKILLTLDEVAAENNAYKTQGEWIKYWNKFEDRWFPSMPELYQVFKHITTDSKVSEKLLTSLRKDFEKRWLLCSTRINYNPNDEHARMVHNFGSRMQKEPIDLEIPIYRGEQIEDVLKQSKGFNYLRQLLQTEDSEEEIIQVFEKLSNKSKDNIKIWTPPFEDNTYYTRLEKSSRAVSLNCYNSDFHIGCSVHIDGSGCSRSVAASAASLRAR